MMVMSDNGSAPRVNSPAVDCGHRGSLMATASCFTPGLEPLWKGSRDTRHTTTEVPLHKCLQKISTLDSRL